MLENRSFDHMLGFLDHPDPTFRGLGGGGFHNVSSDGTRVDATSDGEAQSADPDHSHEGVLLQLAGFGDVPSNGGFVRSYEAHAGSAQGPLVMRCLDSERRCPILAQLAKAFAVCDAWHSSVPGETWPNRNFAHAATSDGASNIEIGLYNDPTIFEQLTRAGASWRIYHQGPAQAWCFRNLWRQSSWLDQWFGRTSHIGNWFSHADFITHVAAGDLPSYSFIEPTHMVVEGHATSSQHPNNNRIGSQDFYAGEALIKSVYEALAAQPMLFAKTLLLVTYDEHGGFYDHVPPPPATPPGDAVWLGSSRRLGRLGRAIADRLAGRQQSPGGTFAFDRLGVRVPAVLISPWIRAGSVVHTTFEHASIVATARALFAPELPSLTRRDARANTFDGIVREFGLERPRILQVLGDGADAAERSAALPTLPELADAVGSASEPLPDGVNGSGGVRSEFDLELLDLSEQVRRELHRQGTHVVDARRGPEAEAAADDVGAMAAADASADFSQAAHAARTTTEN